MKFHKNFHVVALFAAMIALNAQATPVLPAQARRAVSAWAAANGSAFANLGSADSVAPEYDTDGKTVLYYKVKMSNGGLVIASPDTDLDLVVAVLENGDGNFPKGHPLPSILKADMRNRLSVIAAGSSAAAPRAGLLSVTAQSASPAANLPDDVKESIRKSNAQWEKYGSSGAMRMLSLPSDEEIAPYVRRIVDGFERGGRFTHWDQSSVGGKPCYNYYTPYNEVCGCVATAGAAIMQFFGCVEDIGEVGTPEGANCYLYGDAYECKTRSGAIDWSAFDGIADSVMTNVVYETDAATGSVTAETNVYTLVCLTDEKAPEIAGRVTYNLGVLLGMGWGTAFDEQNNPVPGYRNDESGAFLSNLPGALKAYGFDSARLVNFDTDGSEDDSRYFKMVYAQNWAGAPVVLGISEEDSSGKIVAGHAVVACGYAKTADEEDYCRVFMGWGGYGDAWYRFSDVSNFNVIDEAVTMIGYDASKNIEAADVLGLGQEEANALANDMFNKYGTIPVVGKANVTNTFLTLPGVTKTVGDGDMSASFTNTVYVDNSGYFAVRIPAGTEDLRLVHTDSGTVRTITPFESAVLKGEKSDRVALEAAMPSEIMFLVLNTVNKPTVESAYKKALEDGKALLMISGGGSMRSEALFDYISQLDSADETREWMVSNFVIVCVSCSDAVYGDGDPSIGVFDPAVFSPEGRWWEYNGRLSYENFIDHDNSFGDIAYIFDVSDPDTMANMTNAVCTVLRSGQDEYARRHSGITVTIKAVDMDTGADVTGIVGALPQYGVYGNCWTNGETVVFSAPLACTNEAAGISYSCVGWTTNGSMAVQDVVRGCSGEVVLEAGDSLEFAWLLKVKAYRVTSAVWFGSQERTDIEGAVTPAVAWRHPGERITLVATNSLCNSYGVCDRLRKDDWVVRSVAAMGAHLDPSEIAASQNGTAFSFTVDRPVSVLAKYGDADRLVDDPVVYSVSVSVNPPELAGLANGEDSALALGDNDTYDPYAGFAALSSQIVDATGGVWVCTGWIQDGVTNSPSGLIELSQGASAAVELVWELQEPQTPPAPIPGPISVKGLSRSADGEWSIAVEGAVKGCWYTLYAADDISKLTGTVESWAADEVSAVQAAADGEEIVFKVRPDADAQFWRVTATGTKE